MDAKQAPDFSAVSYDEALGRARALIPALRAQIEQGEAERRLPAATLERLQHAGLIRMLQPRRWGGMELPFAAHFDIPELLAQGDPSVAWTLGNLAIHHWMLALYDPRAQEEVWGADPQALIAGGIAFPQGAGRRTDGGFIVSGRWNFSSGVDVCDWNLLACIVREGEEAIDYRMCLVPRTQYAIIDDWHTLGMRATGSKTVVCNDVFVPEHRALCMLDARGGDAFPGARVNPNPMYRISLGALGQHTIAAVVVGNAQAALEETMAVVKSRSTSYTGSRMRDFQGVQMRIAAAAARIDMARTILRADCVAAEEAAARSRTMPDVETKLRFRRNAALGTRLCVEAVDTLHAMMGANGIYDHQSLQRMMRDQHAAAAHISLGWDAQMANWGLAVLGGEVRMPTL